MAAVPSSLATALVAALEQPDPSLPERAVRSTPFTTPTGEVVTSWKVAEHLYRSHTAVLPTLARGLFTTEDAAGEHRVVGRGYDKFFNVDEVAYTSVRPSACLLSVQLETLPEPWADWPSS
jgi:hypothetical protein